MTIAYYHGLQLSGSDRVKKIIFAGKDGDILVAKLQDAGVNVLDTLFFARHAPWMLPVTPLYDRWAPHYTIKGDKPEDDDDD